MLVLSLSLCKEFGTKILKQLRIKFLYVKQVNWNGYNEKYTERFGTWFLTQFLTITSVRLMDIQVK